MTQSKTRCHSAVSRHQTSSADQDSGGRVKCIKLSSGRILRYYNRRWYTLTKSCWSPADDSQDESQSQNQSQNQDKHSLRSHETSESSQSKSSGTVRRIDVLSRPKPLPADLIEDRRSVYWVDKKPIQANGHTEFVLSGRLAQLAAPKQISQSYMGDRPTPIWPVSENAKQASLSGRLDVLSSPKIVHSHYKYERSPFTVVTPGAQSATASERMYVLATPKPHKIWHTSDDTYRGEDCTSPIRPVSNAARQARCTPRVESLAAAKETHDNYRLERSVQWPVQDVALNAVATLRLQQLARPKSGRLKKDDYDPYRVSIAAKSANPTPRVTELSLPIPRKVRQKKVY